MSYELQLERLNKRRLKDLEQRQPWQLVQHIRHERVESKQLGERKQHVQLEKHIHGQVENHRRQHHRQEEMHIHGQVERHIHEQEERHIRERLVIRHNRDC